MITDPPVREYGPFAQTDGDIPDVLWHYTDAAGLTGIATSGALRFGNARFLNDPTEQQYGWTIVNQVLDARIAQSDGDLAEFLPFVKEVTDPVHVPGHIFVCSLSEQSDSISQWGRYGGDGRGYCLGIRMRDVMRASEYRHAALRKLIYSEADQRAAVDAAITEFGQTYGNFRRVSKDLLTTSKLFQRGLLILHLSAVALTLKNPQFADEMEWRLVLLIDATKDFMLDRIRFSPRGTVAKPHLDLPVDLTNPPMVPVRSLVCGPRSNGPLARETAKYLFELNRQPDVTVDSSGVAWR